MMTRGGEGGKKCRKFDDVICERPLTNSELKNVPIPLLRIFVHFISSSLFQAFPVSNFIIVILYTYDFNTRGMNYLVAWFHNKTVT